MMHPKRVLLVGLLVGALALVVGAGFVYMTLAGVGEGFRLYVSEGLLGPEDQRRRVELPEHGISVAMPRGWAMECPRSGLDQDLGGAVDHRGSGTRSARCDMHAAAC